MQHRHFINKYKSPLHYLFFITQFKPKSIETIDPLITRISHSKETALECAIETHQHTQYKVYTDRSSFEGGVGAAAVLYKNNQIMKYVDTIWAPPWSAQFMKQNLSVSSSLYSY